MKINFTSLCGVSEEKLRANERYSKRLGFPRMGEAGSPRLAIAGGGPSIKDRIDELRSWDGEIWAINGTWKWLRNLGIDATFFTIDPSPGIADMCLGAERAVLAMNCDPSVFDILSGDITAVKLGVDDLQNGPTSASTAPIIAVEMGYRHLTFFGCEGNYGELTHVYNGANFQKSLLKVNCNNETFLVCPAMFMQTEFLAGMIRAAPNVLEERSGGFLRAMVADPDYDIVAASREIVETIEYN